MSSPGKRPDRLFCVRLVVFAQALTLVLMGLCTGWQCTNGLFSLGIPSAFAAPADNDTADRPEANSRRGAGINRSDLPAGVTPKFDLPYGTDPLQKVDVYLPEKTTGAPIILMVHGGAWQIGDKSNAGTVLNKIKRWCPQGFIFVSVNYRLVPTAGPIDQAIDVAKALAFVQSQAKSWGGDANRCILMGHSSGAHLVSLLTADPSIATKCGARPWRGTVSLDSAAMDVPARMHTIHQHFWDQAFGNDETFWKSASPIYRLTGATKPMLLVYSSIRENSTEQDGAFAKKVNSLGGKATLLPEALRHGPINTELGLPGAYTEKVDAFINTLIVP